jgi:hypothetical protein
LLASFAAAEVVSLFAAGLAGVFAAGLAAVFTAALGGVILEVFVAAGFFVLEAGLADSFFAGML